MAFNLEDKITYNELAPSLQRRLDNLRAEIDQLKLDLGAEISARKTSQNDIYKKIKDLANSDVEIKNSIATLSDSVDNMSNTINNYSDPCSGTCNWSCQVECDDSCRGFCGGNCTFGCEGSHSGGCSTR